MRRLLVTGGAGFIGSHFVEHCLVRGLVDRLVVLDVLSYAGHLDNLEAVNGDRRLRFVQGDIRDRALVESLLREERLSAIVNFAAETSVDRSLREPSLFLQANVEGVLSLLDAAAKVWCAGSGVEHRFHQISTDEVFGTGSASGATRDESSAYAPASPYSATKAAADMLVKAWRKTHGLRVSISYSSNAYGPRQQTDKLIPLAIDCLLSGRQVPMYGDGCQSRNWIFVTDLCRALSMFLAQDTEGAALCLGGDTEISNLDLVLRLTALAGREPAGAWRYVADRPGHDLRYGISSGVFRGLSGFTELVGLDEGLVTTFNWYRDRRARLQSPG